MNINCKNIQGSFLFAISIRKKEDLYILLCVVRCLCSGPGIILKTKKVKEVSKWLKEEDCKSSAQASQVRILPSRYLN